MARKFLSSNPGFSGNNDAYTNTTNFPAISSSGSFSLWYNNTTLPGSGFPNQFVMITSRLTAGNDYNYIFTLDATVGIFLQWTYANNQFATIQTTTAPTFDTGVWHHLLATTNFTSTAAIYLDGVSLSVTTSSLNSPETISDRMLIGGLIFNDNRDAINQTLADVAIWATQLTQLEATALAQGQRPGTIRPKSLAAWWPLDGLQSTEPDLSGNAIELTPYSGPTLAFGPPFAPITPRWPQFTQIAAAASFKPAWAIGRNKFIDGFAS